MEMTFHEHTKGRWAGWWQYYYDTGYSCGVSTHYPSMEAALIAASIRFPDWARSLHDGGSA
jgi:hypothetical protein